MTNGGWNGSALGSALLLIGCMETTEVGEVTSPQAPIPTLSLGFAHTCAIDSNDALYCWGENTGGQLGDGTTAVRSSPVRVGDGAWAQVSAGFQRTCAIRFDGTLSCWGADDTEPRSAPAQVDYGEVFTSVSTGSRHTCAIVEGGGLRCWGANSSGQLGIDNEIDQSRPVRVSGSQRWAMVSAGSEHTCAIDDGGALYCWGSNGGFDLEACLHAPEPLPPEFDCEAMAEAHQPSGQLGDGTSEERRSPVRIGDQRWLTVVAGSTSTCAIRNDRTLWCWGSGPLGIDGATQTFVPLQVGERSDWRSVTIGTLFACATNESAQLFCWGSNIEEALGLDATGDVSMPTLAEGEWQTAVAGGYHLCALDAEGALECWGENQWGQVGNGQGGPRSLPGRVGTDAWTEVAAGQMHACGIHRDGSLSCWGRNLNGALGVEGVEVTDVPIRVGAATDWTQIGVSYSYTCGLRGTGELWCWGTDVFSSSPTAMPPHRVGDDLWRELDINGLHACGIRTDGAFLCFEPSFEDPPVNRGGSDRWLDIAASDGIFTCAVREDGALFCEDTSKAATTLDPLIRIGADADWVEVSAGPEYACGRRADDRLFCWGEPTFGQLGSEERAPPGAVTEVTGALRYRAIATGVLHACGVRTDGTLACWGSMPGTDQLGSPPGRISMHPEELPVAGVEFTSVYAGWDTAFAIDTAGALWSWGNAFDGVRGDGGSWISEPTVISLGGP